MKTIREYFRMLGRHDDSPLTVGDLIALDEHMQADAASARASHRQAEEAAVSSELAQLEAAPAATAEEIAGGPRHRQEDTERAPLALV